MSLDLVLNDLSFVPLDSRPQAQEKMSGLMQTVAVFELIEVRGALRHSPNLYSTELVDGYTVHDWIFESPNETARLLFKSKATKSPFLADEPLAEAKSSGYEFTFNGNTCEALGAAYLLDVPALSLDSAACWREKKLGIQVSHLDESSGEISTSDCEIVHAATLEHTKAHRDWIRQRLSSPIKAGADIWSNRQTLYPNLEFCIEVEKQLQRISMPSHLHQIQRRLEALEQYDDEWTDERMKTVLPEFSSESQSTMNRYANLRDFTRSNGAVVRCEWHMKMKRTLNLRLHFYWDKTTNTFVVGYIGTHLPT